MKHQEIFEFFSSRYFSRFIWLDFRLIVNKILRFQNVQRQSFVSSQGSWFIHQWQYCLLHRLWYQSLDKGLYYSYSFIFLIIFSRLDSIHGNQQQQLLIPRQQYQQQQQHQQLRQMQVVMRPQQF